MGLTQENNPLEQAVSREGLAMLKRLADGNRRFISGLRSVESIATVSRLAKLASEGQKPFAIVLGCSDSRIPAELLFDQGLGDLFIVRVAGNVVAPSLLASMEFAATSFNCPLLVVMGHSKCGAIQSAVNAHYQKSQTMGLNLKDLIDRIKPSVQKVCLDRQQSEIHLNDVAQENVRTSIASILEQSESIRERVESGKLLIVGAMIDIETGRVSFDTSDSVGRHYTQQTFA